MVGTPIIPEVAVVQLLKLENLRGMNHQAEFPHDYMPGHAMCADGHLRGAYNSKAESPSLELASDPVA